MLSFFQTYFRELLRMMEADFYAHVLLQDDAMDMLFCHRWLLLSFKREFFNEEVLRMWEACWSRYQTDYFHIFLCVAMVQEYGKAVVEQDMPADDMLQYFTDLSMKMDGTKVLRIARQLLLKFRQLPGIPCSLRGLLSGPGVWDSAPLPEIQCSCHDRCVYLYGEFSHQEQKKSEPVTENEKMATEKDNRSEHLVCDIGAEDKDQAQEKGKLEALTENETMSVEKDDRSERLVFDNGVEDEDQAQEKGKLEAVTENETMSAQRDDRSERLVCGNGVDKDKAQEQGKLEASTENESAEKDGRPEHLVCDNGDIDKASIDLQRRVQLREVHDARTCELPAQNIGKDDDVKNNDNDENVGTSEMKENINDIHGAADGAISNANQCQLEQQAPKDEKEEVNVS